MDIFCTHTGAIEIASGTWAFSQTECYATATTTTSTFAIATHNGFTYGELIISTLIFLTFAIVLYGSFHIWLRGIKIKQI